jgi:hypothetical protein
MKQDFKLKTGRQDNGSQVMQAFSNIRNVE